jgi:hypothetical protein
MDIIRNLYGLKRILIKNMKKKLKYISEKQNEFFPKSLFPSKNYMPDWYKNEKIFEGGKPKIFGINDSNKTYKSCVPFLDSLTTGYMVELWTDIFVEQNKEGLPIVTWDAGPTPVFERSPIKSFVHPYKHYEHHFAWMNPYAMQTPKDYGLLITHPFNRHDLPFTTLTGIVDSDDLLTTGQIPFFIKEEFHGVIKAGTPIFQIIPFKKESWIHEEDISLLKKNYEQLYLKTRVLSGFYKKNLWKRRTFE